MLSSSTVSLYDSMDNSPPGSSVHGTSQARILEWGSVFPFPPPEDLPDPEIKPESLVSPSLQVECFFFFFLPLSHLGSPTVGLLGWEDSPGEGNGYPLQYSGLENSMDCIVHGVSESQTQLNDFHLTFFSTIRGRHRQFSSPYPNPGTATWAQSTKLAVCTQEEGSYLNWPLLGPSPQNLSL